MKIARSKRFQKQYNKLPAKIQKQFTERLKLYVVEETHCLLHAHSLTGKYKGYQSFNVNADVRAVFVFKGKTTLYFSAIDSHSELYG
jgi:mRNA-degrading endonuclease YafQ of YafQ-DinJ toxin-antitoxin module